MLSRIIQVAFCIHDEQVQESEGKAQEEWQEEENQCDNKRLQ